MYACTHKFANFIFACMHYPEENKTHFKMPKHKQIIFRVHITFPLLVFIFSSASYQETYRKPTSNIEPLSAKSAFQK